MKKIIMLLLIALITMPVYAQQENQSIADNVSLVDIQEATKKIREKEKELLEKEQVLKAREESLKVMEQDLIVREDELKKLRQEISAQMELFSNASNAELDKLAKLYSSTKPKAAASILIKMDPDKSAALIRRMNAMNAGRIMAEMGKQDPDYASRVTTKLSGGNTGTLTIPVTTPAQ